MTADLPERTSPRTSANVARALLAISGCSVAVRRPEPVEDLDGNPLGVEPVIESGTLWITPEALGWTRAELDAAP